VRMLRISGPCAGVRAMATSEAAIRAIEALNEVCGKRESRPVAYAQDHIDGLLEASARNGASDSHTRSCSLILGAR
jgi:hypothetical protein